MMTMMMINSNILCPAGKSYFVCDHQRSVFLFLCALNRTCQLTGYPCSSYSSFLDGQCLQCEAFKPASCPVLGTWTNLLWRSLTLTLTLNLNLTLVLFQGTTSASGGTLWCGSDRPKSSSAPRPPCPTGVSRETQTTTSF